MKIAAIGIALTLGLLASLTAAGADEVEVPLKDVPKVVLDAVKARFPGAELKEAAKETQDGRTTYEVALKAKGRDVDASLTPEGKFTAIETRITPADLPKAVATAIEAKYPKATVKKAEEIVEFEGDKETKSFEVLLATGAKEPVEVKLSPDGKVLEVEEGGEDKGD